MSVLQLCLLWFFGFCFWFCFLFCRALPPREIPPKFTDRLKPQSGSRAKRSPGSTVPVGFRVWPDEVSPLARLLAMNQQRPPLQHC